MHLTFIVQMSESDPPNIFSIHQKNKRPSESFSKSEEILDPHKQIRNQALDRFDATAWRPLIIPA